MVDKNDDILLRDFFKENKQEVKDNGFSRRVMNRLPEHKLLILSELSNAVTFVLAVVLFFVFGGIELTGNALREVFTNFNFTIPSAFTGTDPRALVLAFLVLLFMGYKKLASME